MFKHIALFAAVAIIGLAAVSTNAHAGAPHAGAVAGLIKSSFPNRASAVRMRTVPLWGARYSR